MPFLLTALLFSVLAGHRDPSLIPRQCPACHAGHGVAGTKLMARPEPEACLTCHGGSLAVQAAVERRDLSAYAHPADLSQTQAQPYRHPDALGCTCCHAGHGVEPASYIQGVTPKPSPKKKGQFEFELCRDCHAADFIYQDPTSFHAVTRVGPGHPSPSLREDLSSQTWLNCSDCHRSSVPGALPGVHSSLYAGLISGYYQKEDGDEESAEAYAACYACHRRESILGDESFPMHREHVAEKRVSCFTCHMSHASRTLPHLLSIEDETRNDRIFPDSSGRKLFEDTGDRSGVCYLTCHNMEHDGWAYGPDGAKRSLKSGKMKKSVRARKGLTDLRSNK